MALTESDRRGWRDFSLSVIVVARRHRLILAVLLLAVALLFVWLFQYGPWRVSCTDAVIADRDRHIEVLIEVRDRHRDELMAVPGVNGLGVGIVYEDGQRSDKLGVVVYIDTQIPSDQRHPSDVIPARLEGCIVSIRASDVQPAN